MQRRRSEAERIRKLQEKTHHIEVLSTLDHDLEVLDGFIDKPWFRDSKPYPIPRLTDLLPIQRIMESLATDVRLSDRKYDEKFHILQSPELFLQDLEYFRAMSDLRGTSTSVAFVDIDDFKKTNKKHSETIVDRNILPRFMMLLEAHVYLHGQAYRQGGDEYLIIVPGLSSNFANRLLHELRLKISECKYHNIDEGLTVSIGICTANEDCHLTNREIQQMANISKEHAKEKGKNCCSYYDGNHFTKEDLKILTLD